MKKLFPSRRLTSLLPLTLLLLLPTGAAAADTYEAAWNGGHLIATANADFTEATIENVEVSFDRCGTEEGELTCTWEGRAVLVSHPESRCDPGTPERQVIWASGKQSGNGTVTDGSTGFPLEGCRGQTLIFELEEAKTYEEGTGPPWVVISSGSIWGLFTFGYHPVAEEEQRIINASPPTSIELPHLPPVLSIAADCRSLTIGSVSYVFIFHQMGCRKAANLARMRYVSRSAPSGYACRRLFGEGIRCWRWHKPAKFFEWHLPRSRG